MNSGTDSGGFDPGLYGLPPLSLYVHLPWCVRKCPYCDFNSHEAPSQMPAKEYVDALLADLELDLPLVWGRGVQSIFFGGGTPSLFSAKWIEYLLDGIRARVRVSPQAEITLEANPGTTEHDSFSAYRDAGVNRVSLGVQSFNNSLLQRLGRIHGCAEIETAIESIQSAGISNFNIDLMYALAGQSVGDALDDVRRALNCAPSHLSFYQLTIEPNTAFHASPPELPDDDSAWEMQEQCGELFLQAGFRQYEISAWAREGFRCRHNLNYWRYGDFLGIGAGAHSKLTLPAEQSVRRRVRQKNPGTWLKAKQTGNWLVDDRLIGEEERVFEFFLNQLRLYDGVRKEQLTPRTGVSWSRVAVRVEKAIESGLLKDSNGVLMPTSLGWRFSNEIQAIFLPSSL
jgi:putative oxygen-independent coproporphyrinogen III oxidase